MDLRFAFEAWGCYGTFGAKPLPGLHFFSPCFFSTFSAHVSSLRGCLWHGRAVRRQYAPLRPFGIAETTPKAKKAREKKYKRTESFVHLSREERSRLLEDALDLVGEHRGISLFGEAVSKAHPAVVGGHIDPVRQAFEQVVSRFDAFLKRRDEWKLKKSPQRTIDNGLLVLDQDYSMEASIVSQFRDYRLAINGLRNSTRPRSRSAASVMSVMASVMRLRHETAS